jgi:hypothetical protein
MRFLKNNNDLQRPVDQSKICKRDRIFDGNTVAQYEKIAQLNGSPIGILTIE